MNSKEKDLLDSYNALKPHLENWGNIVDDKLMGIALSCFSDPQKIKIPCSKRIKSDESFISKALYRGKEYDQPLLETEDKVGTRIVVLTTDDVNTIAAAALKNDFWNVKTTKDFNEINELNPESFSYQSYHLVVTPKPSNQDFIGVDYNLISCEIQIRTLLQHAYSEISHDSTYKGPFKNDKEIIRQLSKSMALMEATDDFFCDLFKKMSDETRVYAALVKELQRLYLKFNPNYDLKNVDFALTRILLSLYDQKNLTLTDIETFTVKYEKEISTAISNEFGYLIKQPVFLLPSYYLFNHQTFLVNNWPLSQESLSTLFLSFGFSRTNY